MVQLKIGTNTERKTVIVDADEKSLEEILNENEIQYVGCAMHLNGSLLAGVDLQATLSELGVADNTEAMLIAVKKADSAR